MKYRLKMGDVKMEEVKETPKNMMDIIKSKLTPIEYLIFTHNITELVKKELKKSTN